MPKRKRRYSYPNLSTPPAPQPCTGCGVRPGPDGRIAHLEGCRRNEDRR